MNRRKALGAIGIGTLGSAEVFASPAGLPTSITQQEPDSSQKPPQETPEAAKRDKQIIMEAGLSEAEAECWRKVAEAAGAFFQLPELHPTDRQEIAQAVHVIQYKLLARPTYRKYLKLAKEAAGEK